MIEVAKSLILKDGKYLVIRRAMSSKFFPGLWDFPGGKIEQGEDPDKAVIRETREETSLEVTVGEKLGDYDYTEKGNPIHFQIYSITKAGGKVKLSKDHTDHSWIAKEEMQNYDLAPIVKLYFNLE